MPIFGLFRLLASTRPCSWTAAVRMDERRAFGGYIHERGGRRRSGRAHGAVFKGSALAPFCLRGQLDPVDGAFLLQKDNTGLLQRALDARHC